MEELIKEAESLYWQIDKVVWNLIATRENNDDEGKKKAISDMETAMCGTQQFLKCILERKDNIVDLSKIWKDGKKEKPLPYSDIVVRDCCISSNDEEVLGESKWAYLEDLLPKGGEK